MPFVVTVPFQSLCYGNIHPITSRPKKSRFKRIDQGTESGSTPSDLAWKRTCPQPEAPQLLQVDTDRPLVASLLLVAMPGVVLKSVPILIAMASSLSGGKRMFNIV